MSWSQWDKIIAQYTLHTSVQLDNKSRPVQSVSLDVSTKNSDDGPSKATIQSEEITHSHIPKRRIPSLRWSQKEKKKKKKKTGSNPQTSPFRFQSSSHLITVFHTLKSCNFAVKLIFVIWISRQCPFIKVCRQSRKTFLLLYCLFFIFIIIILFLSHYLRSAISLPFFIGSFWYLASW